MDEADYGCRRRLPVEGFHDRSCNIGINNGDVYHPAENPTNEESVQDNRRKWPFPVWLILKILCVFYHRKVTRKRTCYSCYVKSASHQSNSNDGQWKESLLVDPICLEYEYDGEGCGVYENEVAVLPSRSRNQPYDCDVCNMIPWSCRGEAMAYSDSDIGVSSWNTPLSKFFSVIGVTFALVFILYDFGYYIYRMFGLKKHLLHFISYCGFLACLSTYPVLNICSKIRSFLGQKGQFANISWATTLNLRFITKRLQLLNLPIKGLPGKPFLILCILWPSCNAFYRFFIYTNIIKYPFTPHVFCTLAGIGTVMIMWGCFAYLLYLMRLSFQREFMLILNYFKKREGALDKCRNCLSHVMLDFNCFRKFIKLYMAVMVPFTVLEVTTNVTRQYRLGETCQYEKDSATPNINVLIWSNTAMFIVLNVIAIGGLDVNHVWDNFVLNIIEMQTAMHYSFWRRIFTHLKRNQGDYSTANLTLVFSVVGFYMGLQLGDGQDVGYGNNASGCNMTNITQPTDLVGYSILQP